jgi:hexosaminidase
MKNKINIIVSALLLCFAASVLANNTMAPTELRLRGYSLVPAPQKLELRQGDVIVDQDWAVVAEGDGPAAGWLKEWAQDLHGLTLSGTGGGQIILAVNKAAVAGVDDPGRSAQAYKLEVSESRISITGNTEQGLFYGVQSFLHLLRRKSGGRLCVPAGSIIDWPTLELRFIHWDTKHHQKRPADMRRIIDWLAFFKVNAIGMEMEDKYEFPSHPLAGAPGAYTKAEMQELTRYALERHIQLVPVIQAPAHMTWLLKHKQYEHLKADDSNYLMCMCDEEGMQIIRDLYQDMIDATPGVKYFHASTDEVYYAGICDKCKREYSAENRSLYWTEYVNWMHKFLAERDRTMLCWVEFPLLPEHIKMLPSGLIDAISNGGKDPVWIDEMNKAGIPQLAYSSMQGAEYLFPNLFPTTYRGKRNEGRLQGAATTVPRVLEKGGNLLGTFCAYWDDSGLHEETAWLGWVAVSQYGWNHVSPGVDQAVADFMDVFYGPEAVEMVEAYKLLEQGARFFEDGWDRVVSKERGQTYGSSHGPFPYDRHDQTLSMPQLPEGNAVRVEPTFAKKYRQRIDGAWKQKKHNDRLVATLMSNLSRVERNSYNIEVLLSLARLERYFVDMLTAMEQAENSLVAASDADVEGKHAAAVGHLVTASNIVASLLEQESAMWSNLVAAWEKSRYPKNRTVDGREFFHVQDDVKDHFADRRKGLDYMMAPFQRMDIPGWRQGLANFIDSYAASHDVPVQGLAVPRLED